MHRFANPARFLRLAAAVLPWSAGADVVLFAAGLYVRAVRSRRPTTSRARPCASCTSTCRRRGWRCSATPSSRSPAASALVWRHPLADVARAGDGAGRRRLHRAVPRHRLAVGPADVGHVVGVGRAAHLGAGAVLPLSRPHRADQRLRRPRAAARVRAADPGAGRGRQPADHQVLGRLVEHAAPAGLVDAARRAGDRSRDAVAAAADGRRVHGLFRRAC